MEKQPPPEDARSEETTSPASPSALPPQQCYKQVSVTLHSPDGMEEKPVFAEDVIAALSGGSGAGDGSRHDSTMLVPLVELPPPPDGGWGWVVCFASFMCNLILDGIAYTFGVLLEPLAESFADASKGSLSLVGSLLVGTYLTSGPIVGSLVNKFGCRPVCIAGAILACAGLALSTLANSIPFLMLTYGLLGGLGLGFVYLPSVVAVGYYFERRRALATGISVCGSGVGTFLFAPLATWLIDLLGWRGANLIFAGFCLNCAVFGALMRPLELTAHQNNANGANDGHDAFDDDDDEDDAPIDFVVHLPDGTQREHRISQSSVVSTRHRLSRGRLVSGHRDSQDSVGGEGSLPLVPVSEDIELTPSGNVWPPLPTITESSITKQEDTTRPSVKDIFPDNSSPPPMSVATDEEDEEQDELLDQISAQEMRRQLQEQAKAHRRKRTVSDTNNYQPPPTITAMSHKFLVTPNKLPAAGIPRNSTAPNFVDPTAVAVIPGMPGMPSVVGGPCNLGRLTRLHSHEGHGHYRSFGINSSLVTSNATLALEPTGVTSPRTASRAGSRRGSKAIIRPLYRKDILYTGSVAHLIHSEKQRMSEAAPEIHESKTPTTPGLSTANSFVHYPPPDDLERYRHSVISIPRSGFFSPQHRQSTPAALMPRSSIVASHLSIAPELRKLSSFIYVDKDKDGASLALEAEDTSLPLVQALKQMINMDLLTNPLFLLLGISSVLGMLGFYTPYVYLPALAVSAGGVAVEDANFLISIIGISNTVARVLAGWVSDFECVNSLVVTNLAILMSGLCVIAFPVCASSGGYAALVAMSLAFGAAVAAYISLTSIVLVDLLGLDNLTSSFGLLVLFRGVSSTVGSPLAGFIFDVTESYAVSFYISGAMLVAAAVVSAMADLLHRKKKAASVGTA